MFRECRRTAARGLAILGCGILMIGCAQSETAEDAGEAMPAMLSLADLAGMWSMRAMTATGDSTLVTFEMTASEDPSAWTMHFEGRDPVPGTVTVAGDSAVSQFGPYESALRSGVMVSVRSVIRLQGERMMGTFVARYQTTGPDSILRGRLQGTRMMGEMDH